MSTRPDVPPGPDSTPAPPPASPSPAQPKPATPAASATLPAGIRRPLPPKKRPMSTWVVVIFSGLAVIAAVVGITMLVLQDTRTPPAKTLMPGMLELKEGENLSLIVPEPTGDGNAADDYVRAFAAVKEGEAVYKGFIRKLGEDSETLRFLPDSDPKWVTRYLALEQDTQTMELLRQIEGYLANGAAKKELRYVGTHTKKLPALMQDCTFTRDFGDIPAVLGTLAQYYLAKKNYAGIERIYQNEIILGWQMVNERALAAMTGEGIGLQQEGLRHLNELYSSKDFAYPADHAAAQAKLAKLQTYKAALDRMNTDFQLKAPILQEARPHVGDVLNMVENDKDRAWRNQAILAMGMLKFRCSTEADTVDDKGQVVVRKGDAKQMFKLANELSQSPDPTTALAAQSFKDFTKDDWQESFKFRQ